MTNDEAKAAKARAEAATPGPWKNTSGNGSGSVSAPTEGCAVYVNAGAFADAGTVRRWKRDAAFIAAARTDVPALVDDLLEARAGKALALEAFEKGHALVAALEHDNADLRVRLDAALRCLSMDDRTRADYWRRLSEMAKLAKHHHLCEMPGNCYLCRHNAKVEALLKGTL